MVLAACTESSKKQFKKNGKSTYTCFKKQDEQAHLTYLVFDSKATALKARVPMC